MDTVRDVTAALAALPGDLPVIAGLPDGTVRSLVGMLSRAGGQTPPRTSLRAGPPPGGEVTARVSYVLSHLAFADPDAVPRIMVDAAPLAVSGVALDERGVTLLTVVAPGPDLIRPLPGRKPRSTIPRFRGRAGRRDARRAS